MNPDQNFKENDKKSSVEERKQKITSDSLREFRQKQKIALAAFARLNRSTRSSLAARRRAFEEAEKKLEEANVRRDETWKRLPEDLQNLLAKATRDAPDKPTSAFLDLKPEELSTRRFEIAVSARLRQLQARKYFYRKRLACRLFLVDRLLLSCSGSSTLDAPFPAAEFEPKAKIIKDLRFCESVDEAMKFAEARWNDERPCVVQNRRQEREKREVEEEEQRDASEIKREMLRQFAGSSRWKRYASSPLTILNALATSAICVAVLWGAILKWNLVYLLRYESIFPYKSSAYRFLYFTTPVVWLGLAYFYRNVVLLRLYFRSTLKEFATREENDDV